MSEREKIKNVSNNVIDIMSTLGKQFVEEALEQGEPILNIINKLTNPDLSRENNEQKEKETKRETNIFNKDKWLTVNDAIKYYGEEGIYSDVFEYTTSYTLLFKLPGVHKQDLIVEKNNDSVEIFCKTSIGDSRIPEFKYKDREIRFSLKLNYDIQCQNVLAELKDGLLKLNIEKPLEPENKEDEIITVV